MSLVIGPLWAQAGRGRVRLRLRLLGVLRPTCSARSEAGESHLEPGGVGTEAI